MKRSRIVGIVVAAVLVVGVLGAVAITALGGGNDAPDAAATTAATVELGDESASAEPDISESSDSADAPGSAPSESATAGAYVDYSEDALAAAQGERVLFFHATWCPRCRALEADILANGVPAGVTILKVDYDSNQALRQQYDVRQQTTVVLLDDQGRRAATFVAYDEPTVAAALAGLGIGG